MAKLVIAICIFLFSDLDKGFGGNIIKGWFVTRILPEDISFAKKKQHNKNSAD